MGQAENSLSVMKVAAIAMGILAATVLTTLAVISGFKDTGLVTNTTADLFITGITIFATFSAVVVLGIMGKVVIGLFSSTK